MKKYFIGIFICGLILLVSLLVLRYAFFETYKKFIENVELAYVALKSEQVVEKNNDIFQLQNLVAHAGGGIENLNFLNSLETLKLSYGKGFRFIELDFEWTSDGHLVLIHDWRKSVLELFNAWPRRYSIKEFKNLKMINKMTNLSLDDLISWIKQYPDVFIITDVKHDNIRALTKIRKEFPESVRNFIPQIYHFYEYFPVRDLGYKHIILTLYIADYSDQAVLKFAKEYPLTAVTMPMNRALTCLPRKLKKLGISTYAHTVNKASLQHKLYANGVFGVYTDFLTP